MANPLVAFDESGHTGEDLLNDRQPIFALASVHLSDAQTDEALKLLYNRPGQEVKFKNLKKSEAGRGRVISLLKSEYTTPDNIKVMVFHKKYMITAKVVDLLIEPIADRDGVDLYKRGANISLANLYHTVMPVIFGEAVFDAFQSSFVRMLRCKDKASIENFYWLCQTLYDTCKVPDFKHHIAMMMLSRAHINEVLEAEVRSLDPAVTALVEHCRVWGEQLGCEFDLVHDKSKPIKEGEEILKFLMDKDEPEIEVGYDRRKATLPLKATGIRFVDSRIVRQVQIADVVVGAAAYWAAGFINAPQKDDFCQKIDVSGIRDLIISAIWPSTDIHPDDLGTAEVGGINMVNYLADRLSKYGTSSSSDR